MVNRHVLRDVVAKGLNHEKAHDTLHKGQLKAPKGNSVIATVTSQAVITPVPEAVVKPAASTFEEVVNQIETRTEEQPESLKPSFNDRKQKFKKKEFRDPAAPNDDPPVSE